MFDSFAVIACDKREAFAQGSTCDEAIHTFFADRWIASLRSQTWPAPRPNAPRRRSSISSSRASPNLPATPVDGDRRALERRLFPERSNQLFIERLDRAVALACAFPERVCIQDLNLAAGVFDETRLLQGVGDRRHARSPDTEHLGKIFLCEGEVVAPGQIPCAQQPAAEPRFHHVRGKARGRLLRLGVDRLLVSHE